MPINYYCDVEVQSQVLATDISNSRVGINLDAPLTTLHVDGTIRAGGGSNSSTRANLSSSTLSFQASSTTYGAVFVASNQFYINTGTSGGTLYIGAPASNTTNLNVQGQATLNTIDNATSDTNKFLVSDSGVIKYRTGDEVRADIGAGTGNGTVTSVATDNGLTGGTITGSGTIEVKYSSGTDNIIYSGFDFTGDTVVGTDIIMITQPGQTTTTRRIGYVRVSDLPFTNNTGTVTGTGSSGRVAIWSGSSSLTSDSDLYFDTTNNRLGIGTTSPSAKLHVDGPDGLIVSNGNETGLSIDNSSYIYKIGDISGGENQAYMQIDSEQAKAFFLNSNVGIGTTSPSEKLEVDGRIKVQTSSGSLTIKESGAASAAISGSASVVVEALSNLRVKTGSSLVENFTVLSDGNVGIGISTPVTRLHIKETSTDDIVRISGPSNGKPQINIYEGSNNVGRIMCTGSADFNFSNENSGNINFSTGGSVRATIASGGDITINNDLTVSGGDITLGGTGRIQGVDTVSASTDAANKLYVDNAVESTQTILFSNFLDASSTTSTLRMPFNSLTETSSNQYYNYFDVPSDGTIKRVRMQNTSGTLSTGFTTTIYIWKNSAGGTPSYQSSAQTASGGEIEIDPNLSISKGDKVQIGYAKSAGSKYWQGVSATIVIEFEQV